MDPARPVRYWEHSIQGRLPSIMIAPFHIGMFLCRTSAGPVRLPEAHDTPHQHLYTLVDHRLADTFLGHMESTRQNQEIGRTFRPPLEYTQFADSHFGTALLDTVSARSPLQRGRSGRVLSHHRMTWPPDPGMCRESRPPGWTSRTNSRSVPVMSRCMRAARSVAGKCHWCMGTVRLPYPMERSFPERHQCIFARPRWAGMCQLNRLSGWSIRADCSGLAG